MTPVLRHKRLVLLGVALCFSCLARAFDILNFLDSAGNNDITAVTSRKNSSYIRIQLPNGTYVPETYVFGPGGVWEGEKVDATIDRLTFSDVAHMMAGPLAGQNYIPGKDPGTTKLLIMVYWGTSHGTEHASESNGYQNLSKANEAVDRAQMAVHASSAGKDGARSMQQLHAAQDDMTTSIAAVAAENHARNQSDYLNVNMLGYDSWWDATQKYVGTPLDFRRDDLLGEIEEDRYFVVLMAYDFQQLWWKKKHRLLWETRFSIRERHHAFDQDLPSMAQYASTYFGQDSHGLVHKEVPMGHVDIGNMKSLGEASEGQGATSGDTPARP
jgi:hypothetical protein